MSTKRQRTKSWAVFKSVNEEAIEEVKTVFDC